MKKFLTVLLALSVVFTYSFSAAGSVFAAAPTSDQEALLVKAEAQALIEAERNLNTALNELADYVDPASGYVIKAEAWQQIKGEVLKATKKAITDATDAQRGNCTFSSVTVSNLVKELYYSAAGCNIDIAALKGWLTNAYVVDAAKYQFSTDYASELKKFDKVDMSLYSNTAKEATSGKTYYELAEKYIVDAKEEIANYVDSMKIEDATSVADIASVIGAVVIRTTAGTSSDASFPYLVMTKVGTTQIDSGLYALNPKATLYKALKLKTIDQLNDDELNHEAEAAAVKAQVQKNYAAYMTDKTVPVKDVELAKAYVTILSWLADEGIITTSTVLSGIKSLPDTTVKAYKAAVNDVETLNAFAAKYLNETGADGTQLRAKETVEKIVKQATTDFYAKTVISDYTATYATLLDAELAIADALIANEAYRLDFAKKVAKAAIEDARAANLPNYYPLEQKAVNAAYDAAVAKVEAAKTIAEAQNAAIVSLTKIKDKVDVDALFANIAGSAATGAALHAPAHAQYEKALKYVAFKNEGLSIRDAAYIDTSGLASAMVEFYGENGARTKSEVEALADKAVAVVDTLPTIGGLADAKAKAEAAINAIPAIVTTADFEVVKSAWDTADAYAEMRNVSDYTDLVVDLSNKAALTEAVSDLHSAMALDLAKKSAAADKNDKAALKSVLAEIEAYNNLHVADEIFENYIGQKYTDTTVDKALEAIKAKELKAVQDAIFAIPLNITESDQAAIENARALYDAFVAEYTDYDAPTYDAVANIGYANLRALTIAETRLATIIADKKIKATESLKISVSTKLYTKSNKIRVNWKVKEGNASYITGYQVYKSTKAHTNYKFMGKTTKSYMDNKKNLKKGQRYFYKVRAYVDVDGERYYSDWSNKGNRIYK